MSETVWNGWAVVDEGRVFIPELCSSREDARREAERQRQDWSLHKWKVVRAKLILGARP
jgi:hypothetical protein